jgi:hypothetical protein
VWRGCDTTFTKFGDEREMIGGAEIREPEATITGGARDEDAIGWDDDASATIEMSGSPRTGIVAGGGMDSGGIEARVGPDTSSAGATELRPSTGATDACRGAVLVARPRDFATGLNTGPPFSESRVSIRAPEIRFIDMLRTDAGSH